MSGGERADGGDRPRHDVRRRNSPLDEPSLGLAPLLCTELFRTLARIKETGVGIFLVEQNAKQSLAIADRGYLLDNGHIVGADTAAALRQDEKVKAAYLGE